MGIPIYIQLRDKGDNSQHVLERILQGHDLVDGGQRVNPKASMTTWRNSRGVEKRLDLCIFLKKYCFGEGGVRPVF